MDRKDLKAIALSLGSLSTTFCLVYFMPGMTGLLALLFLVCCITVVTSE